MLRGKWSDRCGVGRSHRQRVVDVRILGVLNYPRDCGLDPYVVRFHQRLCCSRFRKPHRHKLPKKNGVWTLHDPSNIAFNFYEGILPSALDELCNGSGCSWRARADRHEWDSCVAFTSGASAMHLFNWLWTYLDRNCLSESYYEALSTIPSITLGRHAAATSRGRSAGIWAHARGCVPHTHAGRVGLIERVTVTRANLDLCCQHYSPITAQDACGITILLDLKAALAHCAQWAPLGTLARGLCWREFR